LKQNEDFFEIDSYSFKKDLSPNPRATLATFNVWLSVVKERGE
jgi:hypothetical protein